MGQGRKNLENFPTVKHAIIWFLGLACTYTELGMLNSHTVRVKKLLYHTLAVPHPFLFTHFNKKNNLVHVRFYK